MRSPVHVRKVNDTLYTWRWSIACDEHGDIGTEPTHRIALNVKRGHEFIYHGMHVKSCGQIVHPYYARSKEFADWRKAHGGA